MNVRLLEPAEQVLNDMQVSHHPALPSFIHHSEFCIHHSGSAQYAWPSLRAKDGDDLLDHYRRALGARGSEKGAFGMIFGSAPNNASSIASLPGETVSG